MLFLHDRTYLSYLTQYGGASFSDLPFTPVDNLILSVCSYVDMTDTAPTFDSSETVLFSEAVDALTQKPDWAPDGVLKAGAIPALVLGAAVSPRFAAMRLCACESILDETAEMQFAAMTFLLPDDSLFVAFRGTDDTLVGWKECFKMSFTGAVLSQLRAEEYLTDVAARWPSVPIRVGGHSKGGNLAVWAAVHAPEDVKNRILHVYSNDGPGFFGDLIHTPAYRAMAGRISTYIPQSSIVGILLHQDSSYHVIKSHRAASAVQHDPYTWEVQGCTFRYLHHRSRSGRESEREIKEFLSNMTVEERKDFTALFFAILSSTNDKTLRSLTHHSIVYNAFHMLKAYNELDERAKRRMAHYMTGLLRAVLPLV